MCSCQNVSGISAPTYSGQNHDEERHEDRQVGPHDRAVGRRDEIAGWPVSGSIATRPSSSRSTSRASARSRKTYTVASAMKGVNGNT